MPNPLDLYSFVQQQAQAGRERGTQSRLGQLYSQAIQSPQQDRTPILAQIAQIGGTGAATGAQQSLSSMDQGKRQRLGEFAAVFDQLPDEQKAQAYPQFARQAQEVLGLPVPEQWDPEFAPRIRGIAQALSGGVGSNVQSTYVDANGNRVAIMRDGSTRVLGRNNASIRVLEQEGVLPYGVVTSGGPAGQVVPLGQAQQSAPQPQGWQQTSPTMFTAADGQPIPQEDQAALLRAVQEAERTGGEINVPARRPQGGALPPRLDYQSGGLAGPVRTPTSAEKAAAEAAARQRVELGYLPARQQIETQGAIDRERGVQQARADVERQTNEPQRQEKVRQALAKTENVVATIDDAIDRVGPTTSGFLGSAMSNIPGTAANDLRVTANTIRANLAFDALQSMREASPTGGALGAVSERELALLESAVASLDQSQTPEQLRDALGKVKEHYQNWARSVQQADQQARQRVEGGQAASASGPQPGAVQDGYRFRGGNPADPNSWERI